MAATKVGTFIDKAPDSPKVACVGYIVSLHYILVSAFQDCAIESSIVNAFNDNNIMPDGHKTAQMIIQVKRHWL